MLVFHEPLAPSMDGSVTIISLHLLYTELNTGLFTASLTKVFKITQNLLNFMKIIILVEFSLFTPFGFQCLAAKILQFKELNKMPLECWI